MLSVRLKTKKNRFKSALCPRHHHGRLHCSPTH